MRTRRDRGLPGQTRAREAAILCARPLLAPAHLARIQELAARGVDWASFLDVARRHGLLPLAASHLGGPLGSLIPEPVRSGLVEGLHAHAWRSLHLATALPDIIAMLERQGIPAVPYKGPALAMAAYGDVALREYYDLDILIAPDQLERAARTLTAGGFAARDPAGRIPWTALAKSGYELLLTRAPDRLTVELHWRLVPPFLGSPLTFEMIAGRSRPVDLLGRRIASMSHADTVLTTVLHGAKHGWPTLGAIADLAALAMRTESHDWQVIQSESRRLKIARLLATGLALVQRVLQIELPSEPGRFVAADRSAREAADEVARAMFTGRSNGEALRTCLLHLRIADGSADCVAYLARLALMPTADDWVFSGARRASSIWPYLVRPVRLALKYSRPDFDRYARSLTGSTR
jgi:hypothetical protein